MKLTLKGSFTKQDLIQAFAEEVENYMEDEMTGNATIYLRLRNEEGKSIDYVDEDNHSLEVTVTPESFQETRFRNRGNAILDGYRQNKMATEVANELQLSLTQVESLYQQFDDVEVPPEMGIIPTEQLTTYMLLERELNMENEKNHDKIEWIGITLIDKLHVEKVYSVREYCMNQRIGFQEDIHKSDNILMTKDVAERSGLRKFTDLTKPHGLTLIDGDFAFFYDAERLLEGHGLRLFKRHEVSDGYVKKSVNGLTAEQLKGAESGYVIERSIVRRDFIPVYHPKSLYKMYRINVLSKDEIEQRKGTTLFTNGRTTPYIPKGYVIQDEMKVAGYDEEGREYTEPARPLYEVFGLFRDEDIHPGDAVIDMRFMKKFQMLLKEEEIDINELYPDGMTKEYQYVYRASRVPEKVVHAYCEHAKMQDFIKELKRT